MDDAERSRRVRVLLALEIHRIVRDLEERHEFLVTVWSRHRSREPLLDTVFSRWRSVGLDLLTLVPPRAVSPLERFYAELADLRLYLAFTDDMPTALDDALVERRPVLAQLADAALDALDPEPDPRTSPPAEA